MDPVRFAGKENVPPSPTPSTSSPAPGFKSRRLRFADEARYHPYVRSDSSPPTSSDEVANECIPARAARRLELEPVGAGDTLREHRKGILKATTHPINVVDCAEEGKQRNAPRRHSLFAIDIPADALATAMAKQVAVTTASIQCQVEGLIDAVETLEASLENPANASSEPKGENDNCSPRNPIPVQKPPTPPNSSSSPLAKGTSAVIGLRDVESAYSQVAMQLRTLASVASGPLAASNALKARIQTVIKCLTRDLDNVISPQPTAAAFEPTSSSSILSSSSSPFDSPLRSMKKRKLGRSEAELRRRKVELEVGQAALKLLGVITQNKAFSEAFPMQVLVTLVEAAIRIAHVPSLKSTGDREILAFSAWVMGSQALPATELGDALPRMATALAFILAHPAKANDKTRRIVGETLNAIEHLAASYTLPILREARVYLGQILRFLVTQYAPLRDAAACALGRLALVGAQGPMGRDLARRFCDYYRVELPFETQDPNARRTHLSILGNFMAAAHERDEVPWALTMAAIMPVIAGDRFRMLEDGGPGLWMGQMQAILHHPSVQLRSLAKFAWNHLAYSWIITSETNLSQRPNRIWAMSSKPFHLLTQILAVQISGFESVHSMSGARSVVSILYAFSGFLANNDDLACHAQHLTLLFDSLVQPYLLPLLFSKDEAEIRDLAIRVFAAICGAKDDLSRTWSVSRLLCRPLLAGRAIRNPNDLETVLLQAIDEAIQPEEIPAWKPSWLLANASQLLTMLATATRSALIGEGRSVGLGIPGPLERLWTGLLHSFVTAWRHDPITLMSSITTTAQETMALIALLDALPFAPKLLEVAQQAFSDLPSPPSLQSMSPLLQPVNLEDLNSGDFALLAIASGEARITLWRSLFPTWYASIKEAADQAVLLLDERSLEAMVDFAVLPLPLCNSLPSCVAQMLEATRMLIHVNPRAQGLLMAKYGDVAEQQDAQSLAKIAIQLLNTMRANDTASSLVALLSQQALSRIANLIEIDPTLAEMLVKASIALVNLLASNDDILAFTRTLTDVMAASHTLDGQFELYKSVLQRILAIVEPEAHLVTSLEPFLVSVFTHGDLTRFDVPGVMFEDFWTAFVAKGASPSQLHNPLLLGILLGLDAVGASQLSASSTIDSQRTINSRLSPLPSQRADDIDSTVAGNQDSQILQESAPHILLRLDTTGDSSPDSGCALPDESTLALAAAAPLLIPSIHDSSESPRSSAQGSKRKAPDAEHERVAMDDVATMSKRARRMARSPSFEIAIPASPRPYRGTSPLSASEKQHDQFRRSLSTTSTTAPEEAAQSPETGDVHEPNLDEFLEKARKVWQERATANLRERLQTINDDDLLRLLSNAT